MSILEELNALLGELKIESETSVFKEKARETYAVLTPISDELTLHSDNKPEREIAEVRISLFTKLNYLNLKKKITNKLIESDFTITDRRYNGYETDTGYHQYIIDVAKDYEI